jgi:hypothetical protein
MAVAKRRWRPSPATVVGATALSVIALLMLLNWLAVRRQRVNARVEIAAPVVEGAAVKSASSTPARALPDGEVERTAERVREVSALAMGLSLLAVNEGLQRRAVANVGTLVDHFDARGLLPPGVRRNTNQGVLESELAMIYVRYRPEPLAVEVVSVGRERADGPAVIGRIATGSDDAGAALFIARQLGEVMMPAAFAPAAQVAALNWSVEPLRERAFTPPELEQLDGWLRAQRYGGLGSP